MKALRAVALILVSWLAEVPGAFAEIHATYSGERGPSGSIAFSATHRGESVVGILELGDRTIRWLPLPSGSPGEPAIAPDSETIAVVVQQDGRLQIQVMSVLTGERLSILSSPGNSSDPSWSSTGGSLVFFRSERPGSDRTEIMRWELDTPPENAIRLTNFAKGKQSTPILLPDGKTLAYSTNRFWPGWDVCLLDVASGVERCPYGGVSTWCRPAAHPAGRFLAMSKGMLSKIDIVVLDTASGQMLPVSRGKRREYDVVFSPDGNYLAWAEEQDAERFELVVYDRIQSQEVGRLRSSASLRSPSWAKPRTGSLE